MNHLPENLEKMMGADGKESLKKNKEAMMALAKSADALKLMQMMKQMSGGDLQSVAEAAMKGNTEPLNDLMNKLSKSPEGAKAVENLHKKLPD